MQYFLSYTVDRPFRVAAETFTFPMAGQLSGRAFGLYATEDVPEIEALISTAATATFEVSEITLAQFTILGGELPPDTSTTVVVEGAAGSTFSANLVSGQQSYAVVFDPPLDAAPSVVNPTVNLASDTGEAFGANPDWSTVTALGCTIWLTGIPSASAGTIKGMAFV